MMDFYDDEELGRITILRNARARHFSFRAKTEGLVATCPLFFADKDFLRAIEELRPRLTRLLQRNEKRLEKQVLTPETNIHNDIFQLVWTPSDVPSLTVNHSVGKMEVVYPINTDFSHSRVQEWLLKQIEKNLTQQAKHFLLPRLRRLADEHGMNYRQGRIHRTTSRWGSCSTQGNINLCVYLVLLPAHLRDYVMLHELCHTREMNHSPRFWTLLDSLVDGRNTTYRREMKKYNTSVFFLR